MTTSEELLVNVVNVICRQRQQRYKDGYVRYGGRRGKQDFQGSIELMTVNKVTTRLRRGAVGSV